MIVLDTNVVSEAMRAVPDPQVIAWLDAQEPQTLFLTTVSLSELLSGIALLPKGRRRTALELALSAQVLPLFSDRVLPLDVRAAEAFASTLPAARAAGNNIDFADCAIAAIARAQGFALATRNARDFRGCGLVVLNPWKLKP